MTQRLPRWALYLWEVFAATYGSMMAAASLVYLSYPVVHFFDVEHAISFRRYNRILSEPYFPLQIAMGALAGWYARKRFKHSFAFAAWILPFFYLCLRFFEFKVSMLVNHPWNVRVAHFFGNNCRPPQCWDQMLYVAPTYTSLAYVMGATWYRNISAHRSAGVSKESRPSSEA